MNSFLGKDSKSNLFGVKDHNELADTSRLRERRLSAPNSANMNLSSSRSMINGETRQGRYDTLGSRHHRTIGHPNSEMSFPVSNGGQRPRSMYGPAAYRRFQDSSFSSFSDTNSMTRRPSCDTISTYLSHDHPYRLVLQSYYHCHILSVHGPNHLSTSYHH